MLPLCYSYLHIATNSIPCPCEDEKQIRKERFTTAVQELHVSATAYLHDILFVCSLTLQISNNDKQEITLHDLSYQRGDKQICTRKPEQTKSGTNTKPLVKHKTGKPKL